MTDLRPGRVEVPRPEGSQSNGTAKVASRRFRDGKSRHPIIWAVGQKFQIRALRLCVQQFPLFQFISDTNPDGQHVSPQGTHLFLPSTSLTMARIEFLFRTEILNRVYTPFLRGQVSRGVLLSTDLYLVPNCMKDWSYISNPHCQMKTLNKS
jgi:hypothetical protein